MALSLPIEASSRSLAMQRAPTLRMPPRDEISLPGLTLAGATRVLARP